VSKAAKTLNIILLLALVLVWVTPVDVTHDTGLIALTSRSLVSTPTQQETRTLPPTNNVGDDKDPLLSGWFNGAPKVKKRFGDNLYPRADIELPKERNWRE
jgi:hypothetical protein